MGLAVRWLGGCKELLLPNATTPKIIVATWALDSSSFLMPKLLLLLLLLILKHLCPSRNTPACCVMATCF
jgi:hypothetical protein